MIWKTIIAALAFLAVVVFALTIMAIFLAIAWTKELDERVKKSEHSIYNYIAILTDEEYQKYLKNEVIVTRYGEIYDANDKEVKKLNNWDIVNQHDSWYDDSEVTHETRIINGETIHVLSICMGEENEEFRG